MTYWTRRGIRHEELQRKILLDRLKALAEEFQENGPEIRSLNEDAALMRSDHLRHEGIAAQQLAAIDQKLLNIKPAPEPTQLKKVGTGHLITLDLYRGNDEDPETIRLVVGGRHESIPELDPPHYSCNAPLIQKFIGKMVGETATIVIAGKTLDAELRKIERFTPVVSETAIATEAANAA